MLANFLKGSSIDIWLGPECVSEYSSIKKLQQTLSWKMETFTALNTAGIDKSK